MTKEEYADFRTTVLLMRRKYTRTHTALEAPGTLYLGGHTEMGMRMYCSPGDFFYHPQMDLARYMGMKVLVVRRDHYIGVGP